MTAIDTRTTAELDRARIDVLDKAGWKTLKAHPTRSLFTVLEAVPK